MLKRRLFLIGTVFALIFSLAPANGTKAETLLANADAEAFIRDFGNRAITTLTEEGISDDALQARFRKLFNEGFDVQGIGQFVLGRHWRKATPDERKTFLDLFETFIVQTYAQRFKHYSGEKFEVRGTEPQENSALMVISEVVQPETSESPPIRIDWRVAKGNSGYKVYDVVVEGVSMAITQRSEFSSVIRQGGGQIQALLDALEKKNTELASNGGVATP